MRKRAGRRPRRKDVARTITGRISRAIHHVTEEMTPAKWARIKANAGETADERNVTPLGRLGNWGQLTNAQTAAGFKIGEIFRRFHKTNDLKTHARSAKLEPGFGSADLAYERLTDEQLERLENEARSAKQAWSEVHDVLQVVPGNLRQAVMDLCVFDTEINSLMLPDIRSFLDYMVQLWGQEWKRRSSGKVIHLQRRKPIEVAQIAPKKRNIWNVVVDAYSRWLRPDLADDALAEARDMFWAIKEREEIRAKNK